MKALTHQEMTTGFEVKADPALSADPGKRRVELEFVQRLLDLAFNAVEFAGATRPPRDTFAVGFARMNDPRFVQLSHELEKSVPERSGFGKFRANR